MSKHGIFDEVLFFLGLLASVCVLVFNSLFPSFSPLHFDFLGMVELVLDGINWR